MDKQIHIERFPRIETNYEHAIGAIERTGNPQQARIRFEQALRARGYAPAGNGTWLKDGWAAVMVP